MIGPRALLAGTLLLVGACRRDDDDGRRAFVVGTLVTQDRDLSAERPALVAEKYRLMAEGPQEFLRGTAALFYRDLGAAPRAAAEVVLYGDPHLENFGASPDGDGAAFEATDFDAAVRGPFDWDLQRAALGLAVALRLGKQGEDGAAAAVRSLARAYLEALSGPAGPGAAPSAIVEEVLDEARAAAAQRQDLSRDTELAAGRRRLRRGGDSREVPAPFAGGLAAALEGYRQSRRGGPGEATAFAVKDAVQRLGVGVSSLPNYRLHVLVEGPPGEEDDWILELKEERDPPAPALGAGPPARDWLSPTPPPPGPLSNATRVASGAAALLSSPTLEPDLGHGSLGGVPFLVRRATPARRNLDVAALAAAFRDGTYGAAEQAALGAAVGTLLGRGHGRSGAAAAIRAAAGDADVFADETARRALAAERRLRTDLALFRDALDELGPLLGAPR